jgi:hypothetical protein
MAKRKLIEGKTRMQIVREIRKQLRRAEMDPAVKKARRALLRAQTGIWGGQRVQTSH